MTSSKTIGSSRNIHTYGACPYECLKEIKQAIVNYKLYLSFVREILKMWVLSNKAMSHNWAQLSSTVLESGPLLHLRCICKEEARRLEKQETAAGVEISLDQILGEGVFSDPQEQLCMMMTFYSYVSQQL